jgi:hypothetical protein
MYEPSEVQVDKQLEAIHGIAPSDCPSSRAQTNKVQVLGYDYETSQKILRSTANVEKPQDYKSDLIEKLSNFNSRKEKTIVIADFLKTKRGNLPSFKDEIDEVLNMTSSISQDIKSRRQSMKHEKKKEEPAEQRHTQSQDPAPK